MGKDSNSMRRRKQDRGDNNSRKKPNIGKVESSPLSASAKSGSARLRRSTRGVTSREHNTSTSSASETKAEKDSSTVYKNTRKSIRLGKKDTTPPVKRKSEVLESEKALPSLLRRSDRGKKRLSLASSDSPSVKVAASPSVNRKKLRTERSVKQSTVEAMETSSTTQEVKRSNGQIKKFESRKLGLRKTRRNYKALSKKQLRRDTVPDLDREPKRPEGLSQDDISCFGVRKFNPVEAGDDGIHKCGEKIEEECLERDCERGEEQSVCKSKNVGAYALSDHGPFESSCLNSKCSSVKALDNSQENCVSASYESTVCEDVILLPWYASDLDKELERPEKLQVDHALVVELQFPEVEILPDSRVAEGTGILPFSSSKHDKDVETCVSCCKRRRLDYDSPTQELCSCSIGTTNDVCETSIVEDMMELARCDDSFNDGDLSTCAICKLDGKLLRCDGKRCKNSYHLSCLDIPLGDGLPGVLHCFSCVKKKIEYGAHSVSAEVEAIWDFREIVNKGLRRQRQFFVKYKGLSHIHNHWVSEAQLLLEAPILVSKFDEQKQDSKWRQEWTVPHRLLKKRVLWFPKHTDNSHNDTSNCQYEWLVKWCGLDYEHATWELENTSFLHSSQVQSLIKEFENRQQRAKVAVSFSSSPEKNKKQAAVKLPKLRAGCSSADEHNQLISVNKLFEFWSKGQNAIVIDDQERIANVILFIASLLSDVTRPFLIISSPNALAIWESEFSRLAPFINVVVYSGNQDNRKIIRTCEIYADRGRIMLQVLLSSVETIIEDIEVLLPRWEAIIVDECQDIGISKHFEQIRMLRTAVRILLFNCQLKESTDEHLNVLSLLDSPENLVAVSGLECYQLREKLSPFIAYNCKTDLSRFVEYWVPVSASNVQLEQYCSTLLSNYTTLRSSWLKDIVGGALHDILISTKKCCDHPYFVDFELQEFLNKDLPPVEYLDVGIRASGKLQLLDIVLSEIKSRGKKVLILYQFSTRMLTGHTLDDFLRQRFGSDSYERVDKGILPSKRQAALNKFNDKGSGRFVFLLEKSACSPTIKLASVDAVVIFDSDWYLINDYKAMQKLSFDSSPEPIKIFRLYTCCTMEEKVLDLATSNTTFDSTLQNINRTTSHLLLMWGASYLFSKLDWFHGSNVSNSRAELCSDIAMLQDVAGELLYLFTHNAENSSKNSLITKVQCTGSTYSKSAPLFGHSKVKPFDGKVPPLFWNELLEGKNPRWRFLPGYSHRNRKRVQHLDALPENPDGGPGSVLKKQKKITKNSSNADSPRTSHREGGSGVISPKSPVPFSSSNTLPALEVPKADLGNKIKLSDAQKNLHGVLKSAILEFSEALLLPEDVKTTGKRFLEYIVDNHQIHCEPSTTLQAFQISLVWIAASMLRYKLDKKNSLDVAKKVMGFRCTEEEVINVHSKLRILQKKLKASEKFKGLEPTKDFSDDNLEHVLKKCKKRKIRLLQKHEHEMEDFNKIWEERRTEIENRHKIESVVVRTIHQHNQAVRLENLKRVDEVYARKMDEHTREKELHLQDLREKQLKEIAEEDQKADSWLKKVTNSGQERSIGLSERLGPSEKEFPNGQEKMTTAREELGCGVPTEIPTVPSMSHCSTDTLEENNETNLSDSVPAENNNTSASSRHDGNVSLEYSPLAISPAEQILETQAQDMLPQNIDESLRSSSSGTILEGGTTGCENTTNILDLCAASTHADEINNVTDRNEGGHTLAPPNSELTDYPHVELPSFQQGEQSNMQSRENLVPPHPAQIVDDVLHHSPQHPQQIDLRRQFLDPLQIELDRLRKETEEATKSHEDAKLQLKSEYDEEVKAVLAELRRKYEAKFKGAEAEFLMKKKELDSHQNKVFMNKILAEAYRTKSQKFDSSGTREGPSTNFLHQLILQSSQHRRTSFISGSPNLVLPVPAPPRSSPTIANMQMRQPSTLPIRSILSSGEMRAPAPHLQPSFSASTPATFSASQGMPSQNPPKRPLFSTVAQVPPGFSASTPMPTQQSNVLLRPVNLGTNSVGLHLSQGGVQGGDRAN